MIVLLSFSWLFIFLSFLMIIKYITSLFVTYKYLKKGKIYLSRKNVNIIKPVNMLILIPVLREQNTIIDTIKHFEKVDNENINLTLCIACTRRELLNKDRNINQKTTYEVVKEYIKQNQKIKILAFESNDVEFGDRASQLNYSLEKCCSLDSFSIVGVYDADSRPTESTLIEVCERFLTDKKISMQQPAFFISAANKMRANKENPLLIANALYQNTWSIISEIPMWYKYSHTKGKGKGNYYFIGHGEFFPFEIIKNFSFPEREITDGIQIGYRLAMSGNQAEILYNYCSDDVPHNLRTLIQQHKRWFGGCQRLWSSYSWCKRNVGKAKISTLFSGIWSQFRWAFTANLFIINLIASICALLILGNKYNLICTIFLLFVYAYVLPVISTIMTPIKSKVGLFSILCLPFAIFIKGIGPNLYFFERLFFKKIIYKKVER